ncbi:MAG: EAL domain-containing protein [Leptonema sp. (in: bacteria)]
MDIEFKAFNFSNFDLLPFPVMVIQNWKILYLNQESQNLFKDVELNDQDLRNFLSKEDQNFFKFQLRTISLNKIHTFSIILQINEKPVPILLNLKLIRDNLGNCYFIIVLQQIKEINEKFNTLSKIVLETFTIFGEKLYKELLNKIIEYYNLEGSFLYIYNHENLSPLNLLSYSIQKNLDIVPYYPSEKLLKRIQNFGSVIVGKDFQKYYPEDKLSNFNIKSFIGIKVQLSKKEDILCIVFSQKEIQEASELHFALNILIVKIISEYLRSNQYSKFEKFYKTFLKTNDAICIYDIKRDSFIDFNPSFCNLLGYSKEELKERSIFDLYNLNSKEYKKIFLYYYKKNRLKNLKFRFKIQHKKGYEIPVEASFNFIRENDTTILICIIRDLTYSIQAIEEHKKYLQTLSLLNLHVIELDKTLNVLYINHISKSKLKKIIKNANFLELVLPDYREYIKISLENVFNNGRNLRIRFPVNIEGTRNDWIEGDFVLVKNNKKKFIRGILKDITVEYFTQKQIIFIAENDLLTSLPNRNRLEEDLFKAILRAEKNQTFLAVGFLDLDNFYHVNEYLGHRIGDLLLTMFAERLRLIPEISYSTYRWGGDQFSFIIENLNSKTQISPFIEKLKQITKDPFLIEGEKFFITFSVGIAIYPIDGITIDSIFGEADRAMNYAKTYGRNQVVFASNLPKKNNILSKLEIQSYILQSISEKKIQTFYQPIFDLKIKKIIGMEALARLFQLNNSFYIGPDIFIPLAEDLGLIEELSYYVIQTSFQFLKKLRTHYDLYLSVNISRRLLNSEFFIMNLSEIQNEVGIDSSKIYLEITETLAMLDKESNLKKIIQLKEMGYKITIDDFGTGYSSLEYIQEIPLDILKIDKIFVKKLKNKENLRIIEAIVSLAKGLNLEIVAEGVEDYETTDILEKIGIRYIQGFFFAPPLNPSDFEKKIYNHYHKNYSYFI